MDPELVRRSRRGDERAFEALTIYAHPRLFKAAYGILRDADLAEDATQQTFIDVWRFFRRRGDDTGREAWWYRILVDVCRALDREHDQTEVSAALPDGDPAAPEFLGTVIDRAQLSRGFRRLSVDDRAVLVLHYLVNFPDEDMAVALDVSPGKVEARLEEALHALDATLHGDAVPNVDLSPQGEAA